MKTMIGVTLAALALAQVARAGDKSAAPDGKALFSAKCAACHGKEAKGNPAMAKMYKVDAAILDLAGGDAHGKKDAELKDLISKGKNKMPAFKGKLSDEEDAAIVSYIRSLAPVEPAKSKQ